MPNDFSSLMGTDTLQPRELTLRDRFADVFRGLGASDRSSYGFVNRIADSLPGQLISDTIGGFEQATPQGFSDLISRTKAQQQEVSLFDTQEERLKKRLSNVATSGMAAVGFGLGLTGGGGAGKKIVSLTDELVKQALKEEGKNAVKQSASKVGPRVKLSLIENPPPTLAPPKGGFSYKIEVEGQDAGHVIVNGIKDGVADVNEVILRPEFEGKIGPAGFRSLTRQFREANPEVSSLTGFRVSGRRKDTPYADINIKLSSQEPLELTKKMENQAKFIMNYKDAKLHVRPWRSNNTMSLYDNKGQRISPHFESSEDMYRWFAETYMKGEK